MSPGEWLDNVVGVAAGGIVAIGYLVCVIAVLVCVSRLVRGGR